MSTAIAGRRSGDGRVPDRLQREALAAMRTGLSVPEGVDASQRGRSRERRGVVVLPCGAGKTLLGRWYAERMGAELTIVFVPTLALVPQTLAAYRSGAWRHTAMVVCSDPTSGRALRVGELDGLPIWARHEVTCSTTTRAIARFLDGPGQKLIVSTYHSAPRVADALLATNRCADLVICDEAHRLAGRPRREFRTVLGNEFLPAARRLFLTATPVEEAAWKMAAEAGGDAGDPEVTAVAAEPGARQLESDDSLDRPLTLDDRAMFGPRLFEATFADARAAGRLVDYDVQVLAVAGGTGKAERGAGQLEAVLRAAADGATRVLSFHSRVRSARELAEALDGHALPDGRTVRAEHLEARHRAPDRAAALERLATPPPDTVQVLCSARTLSEGVDVPAADTVVFAEPRSSAVDIVQIVGRAMRTAPGKRRGRVVLAVAPGEEHDDDTSLTATAWRHVWVTLRALASMDERFAAQLRTQAGAVPDDLPSRTRADDEAPGLELDLPEHIDLQRWLLRCLDTAGTAWWSSFDALAAWSRHNGHARPSSSIEHAGIRIGSWVSRQCSLFRSGALDPTRVLALESLPGWAWDARERAWWTTADTWRRVHDEGRPPTSGPQRWEWLTVTSAWRSARRSDRPSRGFDTLADFAIETGAAARRGELRPALRRAADDLPCWSWTVVDPEDGRMLDALADYAVRTGDLNPPHDYVTRGPDGLELVVGSWLTAVRRRRYTGRIAPALERAIELLSERRAIGKLRWDHQATAWRLGYLALRQYTDRDGQARVPAEHIEALPDLEVPLGRWCTTQRRAYRTGQLDPDRATALEALPGWLWEVSLDGGERVVLDDVEHGTRSAYRAGCGCEVCLECNRERAQDSVTEGTDLVDAGPARRHLRLLVGQGAQRSALARATGVHVSALAEIIDGTRHRIRPEAADAVLRATLEIARAHEYDGAAGPLVDATETWTLIDELVALGWPKAWISRELGGDGRALVLARDRVPTAAAAKVAEIRRRVGDRPAPRRQGRPDAPGWTPLPTLDALSQVADERTSA